MKVSDFIVLYLQKNGIKVAFGYPGGMVTHLMESFEKKSEIEVKLCYHEQACSFAACGYSQSTGKIGMAFATSGPGATNLVTGIAHAYFESVPVIFITGQPNTYECKGSMQVRQRGFQETDIVAMVKNITKYAAFVVNPHRIKYELDKAIHYCRSGRPGPVLLDLPMDVQNAEIEDPDNLVGFCVEGMDGSDYNTVKNVLLEALSLSEKPILIAGNGINMLNLRNPFRKWCENIHIPVLTTMISVDLLDREKHDFYGFIGVYGSRISNMIIDQADLVITLGSRLGARQTGADASCFAQNAKLIRLDIDMGEFDNRIKCDEVDVLVDLRKYLPKAASDKDFILKRSKWSKWHMCCKHIAEKLSGIDDRVPNQFIKDISRHIPDHCTITTDVGQNQVWVAQSFCVKRNQRVLFSGGHGAMGFSLPAAIGAYEATHRPVFCFVGDGGLQMNIQELEYLAYHKIPVKILIINNNALGMIRHFQKTYFSDNYTITVPDRGYGIPDFVEIAQAYGIYGNRIKEKTEIGEAVKELLDIEAPGLLEIVIPDFTYVYPKLIFGEPIYNQYPYIEDGILKDISDFIEVQFSE